MARSGGNTESTFKGLEKFTIEKNKLRLATHVKGLAGELLKNHVLNKLTRI